MGAIKVDLAIACNYMQHYEWWSKVFPNIIAEIQAGWIELGSVYASGSAVPDSTKNRLAGEWVDKRFTKTDTNRNAIIGMDAQGKPREDGFMASDSEWVFWMDDDTVPPKGVIKHLLELRREFVSGMYFMGKEPYTPLVYVKRGSGFYSPIVNYAYGSLVQVDAVGMGCALIHKSVYQKIAEAHEVFLRPNASLIAVPRSAISSDPLFPQYESPQVVNDTLVMPLSKPEPDDNRAFPFYAMEYGRTEDYHFGELCANAGVPIYADTSVNCSHWKTKAITYDTYREHTRQQRYQPEA